jgi:biopolymer transport protein ExbD
MKPYDATRNIRQMFHKPNILPYAGVLMVIILMLIGLPGPGWGSCTLCYIPRNIPGALFDDVEPLDAMPVIRIYEDGRVCFDEHFLTDLSNLSVMIMDAIERTQPEENKVYLEIDKQVGFGRVQKVLACIKEADVKDVGIITRRYAALVHFFNPVKR